MQIKPGITADGFRTAVRDYTEYTVVEELAANCYDADATTTVVLLDPDQGRLYVIDDGIGFTANSFSSLAILGAGNKREIPYSKGRRHYLGSYGYGLKSTLNIASKVQIESHATKENFTATIDWNQLDDALRPEFQGFPCEATKAKGGHSGTEILLWLKNPTTKAHLDKFGEVLANLPSDKGNFRCYYGLYGEVAGKLSVGNIGFGRLRQDAEKLAKSGRLQPAGNSLLVDLSSCKEIVFRDRVDKSASAKVYFAGLDEDKVRHLKPGLRGIYVRVHGRLLKQSFTDSKFTYNISKWKKFESGTRVELSIDWLRDQISLSRTGVRFSNEKLETDFKGILSRGVSAFIQPHLKAIKKKQSKALDKKARQRLELAKRRVSGGRGITIPALKDGFVYKPESDGELALLLSQPSILKRALKHHQLIDYNDQASYDCTLYNEDRREFVKTELEPHLNDYLQHNDSSEIQLVITWTKSHWKIGARKRGKPGFLALVADDQRRPGWYKLLEYSSGHSKKPRRDYPLIVLEEVLESGN